MRKPIFCCRLHYISIKGNLGRGERFDDNFFITNDRTVIETLLPDACEPKLGSLEFSSLKKSPVAVYARFDDLETGSEQAQLLEHLFLLDAFENVFWLHADSCVGHELAFVYREGLAESRIWSNIYEGLRCRSDSSQDTLTITADTLRNLIRVYRKILQPSKIKQGSPAASTEGVVKPGLAAEVTSSAKILLNRAHTRTNSDRVSRAFDHVGRAQKSGMFTEKIAFYCSALEALFSTSQSELAHQVAERVAVTATSSRSERLPAYRFVKECYGIRSKYVHGASIGKTSELELEDTSKELDALVRQCFLKLLNDKSFCEAISSDGKLDELMLTRLFE